MHDATEGGVLGALEEMSAASGKSFVVEPCKIPVFPEAAKVCDAFGLDPLRTMGEGALLLTCARGRVRELERVYGRAGIPVARIGGVRMGRGLVLLRGPRKPERYSPGPDLYWTAYDRAERRRLA